MKRYLLFVFDAYYPTGGWNDFEDSYDTIEKATEAAIENRSDMWQIVDSTTGRIVKFNPRHHR